MLCDNITVVQHFTKLRFWENFENIFNQFNSVS